MKKRNTTCFCIILHELFSYASGKLQTYASINSKREHPPGQTPGEIFEVVKSPAPGQNFPAKARPPGQKNTYPRGVFLKI